jgi:hypothetical protein
MAEPLENLRIAYQILKRNVVRTLRTQRGAETQLRQQVDEALQFLAALQLASDPITIRGSYSHATNPSTRMQSPQLSMRLLSAA